MFTKREIILVRKFGRQIDDDLIGKLSQRIKALKKEITHVEISQRWDKKNNKLLIQADQVCWEMVFNLNKMTVYVEAPIYLVPFLMPFKKTFLKKINEEIDALINK